MILSCTVLASDKDFNRDHGIRKHLSNSWLNGSSHVTSHSMRLKNQNSLQWWISHITLGVHWRYQNVRASNIVWWRWVRKQSKEFVTCSWYDLSSFLPCNVLTISIETWGKGLPFTWCMDIKQSTCLLGHCCTLCDQWERTWFVLCIVSLDHTFTPSYRGAPDWLSRTDRGTFWGEYGWGHLGNNGAIWSHWEGAFLSLSSSIHLLMCLQIIAIMMDNASNNNTLMISLERRCLQRGIEFSAQNARMQCMPHTIHLAAIKVLTFMSHLLYIIHYNFLLFSFSKELEWC